MYPVSLAEIERLARDHGLIQPPHLPTLRPISAAMCSFSLCTCGLQLTRFRWPTTARPNPFASLPELIRSDLGETAVDEELGTGDEAGVVRGKEQGGLGDLVSLPMRPRAPGR